MQTEDTEEGAHLTADQFFFHLWECTASLAENVELPESLADHYGQVGVGLLKLVIFHGPVRNVGAMCTRVSMVSWSHLRLLSANLPAVLHCSAAGSKHAASDCACSS